MSRKLAWLLLFGSLGLAVRGTAHAAPGEFVSTASQHSVLGVNRLDAVVPAKLDLLGLGEEDVERDRQGLPPRFAVPQRVAISPARRGTWEDLGNGQMLWRLRIYGQAGTTSLNLGFSRFKMSPNSRLMLYSTDGTQILRPFTAADNEEHGELCGVSAAGELLLGPARENFRRRLTGRGYRPEAQVVAARLGNEAGLIGAADLARTEASP